MGTRRHGTWPCPRPDAHRGLPLALLLLCCLLGGGSARAQRLVAVTPVWQDSVLACRLVTEGLPGERIASSLASGLASAIVVDLELRRAGDGVIARRRIPLRLSYDLWGESYLVAWSGHQRLLASLDSLRQWLTAPPPFPVAGPAALSRLAQDGRLILRAGLTLQPIAPAERRRLAGAVSGRDPDEPDRRERTVGMDHLIRFFFREGESASPLDVTSSPFLLPEVPR